jgi:predicted CopG family antitoxin
MKEIKITLEDKEYKKLRKIKDNNQLSWKELLQSVIQNKAVKPKEEK